MKINAVIFDFDGTLVDSSEAILKCFNSAFKDFKIKPVKDNEITELIGYPLDFIIKKLTKINNQEKIEEFKDRFRIYAREILPVESKIKPGVEELLGFLFNNGIKLAIATSKNTQSTKITLENIGIDKYFAEVIGIDMVENPKPDPEQLNLIINRLDLDAKHVIMVGDTVLDIGAAKKAGVASVALLDGFGDESEIYGELPNFIIADTKSLFLFFKKKLT